MLVPYMYMHTHGPCMHTHTFNTLFPTTEESPESESDIEEVGFALVKVTITTT